MKWNLKRRVGWLVIARVLYTLSQWLMLVSVVHFTNLKTVGIYGAAIAATTLVFRFVEFGLNQAVTTDLTGEYDDANYYRLRFWLNVVASLAVLLISGVLFRFDSTGIICMVMLFPKIVESQTTLAYGFLRRQGRIELVGMSLALRGILGASVFAVVLWAGGHLALSLTLLGTVWVLIAFAFDRQTSAEEQQDSISTNKTITPAGNSDTILNDAKGHSELHRLAFQLLPLGIAGLLSYALGALPMILLKSFSTLELVGVYAALFYPFQAANMIIKSVGEALLQPLAKAERDGNVSRSRYLMTRTIGVIAILCGLGIAFTFFSGNWFLSTIYTSRYAEFSSAFTLLAIAWTLRFLGETIKLLPAAKRNFIASLWIHGISIAPMIVLGPILIGNYDLNGAVWLVGISHIVFLITTCVVTTRTVKNP